jgi:hypothetical protein
MKLAILILFAIPITAEAHAEIFFPKIFSTSELPNTGFVVLNADPTIVIAKFYLLGADGVVLSSPPALQIPPGSQLATLGSELFPDAPDAGWVYLLTDAEGMQAFWLNYNADLTSLDGAEAIQLDSVGSDQIIPFVAPQTELNVISLNGVTVPVTIRIFGADGELAPSVTRNLPYGGALRANVSEIFPDADMMQARYVRVRAPNAPLASTALIRGFQVPSESAVVNGVNVGLGTEMIFPHIVNGALTGANYTTVIGVTNLSNAGQNVTITFTPAEGAPIAATRTLTGNGALRETAESLFGLTSSFQTGWLRIRGTAPLTGFALYADTLAGALSAVPASSPQGNLFFLHIADGPPHWQTGLALLNAGNTAAMAEIYAITSSGSLIGTVTVSLEPGTKVANVIHELIPETRGVNGGFVYVRSTNNVPLYGIELFYTDDLKVLSNVAAGKLVPIIKYVPPKIE